MSKTNRELTKTYHIVFDAIGCNEENLDSEKFVFKLLMQIPKLIDMKVLSGPNIIRDYNPDKKGVTGFAIINFSHISIHTFPSTQEIYIDIFSCREFDYFKIKEYLKKILSVEDKAVASLEVKYPWE
ncbi:MAG: S-adenosylmethionine decarboxylase [Patescibacteria group bacterium]|nr:S-adenosylmethionine decarboxylase [Patescibacteria group bacterium]